MSVINSEITNYRVSWAVNLKMVKLTLEISVLFEFAFLRLDEFKALGAELLLSLGL